MNNQQQLPFAAEAVQWQPQQVNYNNLPFNPVNIQPVEWLRPVMPVVVGMSMDIIQNKINDGPISTFFYNYMAQNYWNNQAYAQFMQDLVDYIFIENQQWVPPPHQIESVIMNNTTAFVTMRALACLIEFPALNYYIQPQHQQAIQQTLAQFQQYMGRINNMRQNMPRGFQGGQPVGYQGNGYQQQQQQQQQRAVHVPYTAGGQAFINQAGGGPGYIQHPQRDTSGARDFVHVGAPAPQMQQQQQPYQNNGTPPSQPQPATNVASPMTPRKEAPMNPNTQTVAPTGTLVTNQEGVWRFSPARPTVAYPPAFNPVLKHLYLDVKQDGTTLPIIQEGTLNVMDYDRHAVASLFGRPQIGTTVQRDPRVTAQILEEGLEVIDEDSKLATEETPTIYTQPNINADTSLDTAFVTAKMEMMLLADKKPVVFRVFNQVYDPIIGWEDETDVLVNFGKSSSYVELREKLKAAGETASPELVAHVNHRMTCHLNHVLHKQLSIDPVYATAEDFTIDLEAITALLLERFGEITQKAFLKNQRRDIRSLFRTIDRSTEVGEQLYQALAGPMLGEEWEGTEKRPVVTFIGQMYSITLLDILSHDLQVAGMEGIGNALTPQLTPTLHRLATNILEADDNFTERGGVTHHLVRTKDGRVAEITEGLFGDDFKLISLVK